MILAYQDLYDAIFGVQPIIKTKSGVEGRIQPSSFDCVLGDRAYRVTSSFLPKENETVMAAIERNYLFDFKLKETGSIFEPYCPYIIPLLEELDLPSGWACYSSPKSSIGRIDLFVRMLSDGCGQYDRTVEGYKGRLFLEVVSLSFVLAVAPNLSLNQIRISTAESPEILKNEEIVLAHSKYGIVFSQEGKILPPDKITIENQSVFLSLDLSKDTVGYRAKKCPNKVMYLCGGEKNLKEDFFEPISQKKGESLTLFRKGESLTLFPENFYLLASCERVRVPPEFCGTLVPYSVSQGEMRAHYAGYFDNGFGYGQGEWPGATAVFEVRVHSVPFRFTHGQFLGRMTYERSLHIPALIYGHEKLGSHYTSTGPKLGKYIKGEW